MSLRKFIGATLIASPFLAIIGFGIYIKIFPIVALSFGITAVIVAVVTVGVRLMED